MHAVIGWLGHRVKRALRYGWRYWLLGKMGLLPNVSFQIRHRYENNTMLLPVHRGVVAEPQAERWLDGVLRAAVETSPGVFVDIGANVGQTLLKLKSVSPDTPYIGFEPNPLCMTHLRDLIQANGFSNCRVYPVGLSDSDHVVSLAVGSDTDSGASMIEGFRGLDAQKDKFPVPVFRGDVLFDSHDIRQIGVVKIDVEGAELEVVRGLESILRAEQPCVICEILPVYDASTERGHFRKTRQDELIAVLDRLEFKMARIMQDGRLETLQALDIHGNLAWSNYLFAPEQKMDVLLKGIA